MHLAIDAISARHGGAATILQEVVESALALPTVTRVSVFAPPAAERRFLLSEDPKVVVLTPRVRGSLGGRAKWAIVDLPRLLTLHGCDAALLLSGTGLTPKSCKAIVFIQQALPFCDEGLKRYALPLRLKMKLLKAAMRYSAAKAALVLVQTETMRAAVTGQLGVSAARVRIVAPAPPVLQEACGSDFEPMRQTVADRRLLYVGNTSPYKDFSVLCQAVRDLRPTFPGIRLFSTLENPSTDEPDDLFRRMGYLSRRELSCAYQSAAVLVMPSVTETICLPLLEAMAAGLPIVVADRPYAREVCGDAARYFAPGDAAGLSAQLAALLRDSDQRRQVSERARERVVGRTQAQGGYARAIVDALPAEGRAS